MRRRELLWLAGSAPLSLRAADRQDFSEAERALFMTPHFAATRPPATLRYRFRHGGSQDAGFDDIVTLKLAEKSGGGCCAASGEFLTGARRVRLPDIDAAEGNPVILFFLEHDIREMQRLTRGSQNHFRRRIRMAIYQEATVRNVPLTYENRAVDGREITVTPYASDPDRGRYARFADKRYVFLLSDAVPGSVYAIRTRIAADPPDAPPLVVEDMTISGASP